MLTTQTKANSKEWLKCKYSFEHFVSNYVYLQDRVKKKTIKFVLWPHLKRVIHLFLIKKLLIILKARQLGISWLICSYAVWLARFHRNVKVLMLSQGEKEAFDLISRCRFIDNHLPDFIKSTRDPDQRGFVGFPATGSEIVALPSTKKAGRSTDATLVVCDEWEYHDYGEDDFNALKPTIGAGGQYIGVSTTNKKIKDTFFKVTYKRARSGESEFSPLFLGWRERPVREEGLTLEEWITKETKDMPDWKREQEYPETEEEALGVLYSRMFFDPKALTDMYSFVIPNSLEHDLVDKHRDLVKLYKLPVIGRIYCCFTDPSDGKEDPHACVVLDAITGEEIAESHGKVTADRCAQIHDDLVRLYNNAFNSYELNARAGGIFSEKIKQLDTPNQAGFLKVDGKLDNTRHGWWTSETLRQTLWYGLEEGIRLRQITIHNPDCIKELEEIIEPEGEKPQAPQGGHDDWVTALGGVWKLRQYCPIGGARAICFPMRE